MDKVKIEPMIPETNTLKEKVYERSVFEDQVNESTRPVINDVGLSIELLETSPQLVYPTYAPSINTDSVKANYNPLDLSAVRFNSLMANYTALLGDMIKVDLTPTQALLLQANSVISNTSRGKGGWAGYLAKTNKSISETTLSEKAQEIAQLQSGKKSFFDKIRGK